MIHANKPSECDGHTTQGEYVVWPVRFIMLIYCANEVDLREEIMEILKVNSWL